LTFSSEVHHVWGRKWEITRIVFTISRYLPFVASAMTCYSVLYGNKCGVYNYVLDVIYNVCVVSAEAILILRTYALWGRSRRVLAVLIPLAVTCIIAATLVGAMVKFSLPEDSQSPYVWHLFACGSATSRSGGFEYVFLMTHEIVLQSMNTWRKFRTYGDVQSQTLSTLYWDGIMYMFWIILLTTANMAVIITAPMPYIPSLDTAQVAIHGVLASRIFFNLRECDERIHNGCSGSDISLEPLEYGIQPVSTNQWSVGASTL